MSEVDIDASFTFEVNTTTSLQSIGNININPTTVLLAGSGDLYVGNSGSQFDINGSLTITIDQTGLDLNVNGTAKLGPLGNLAVAGDLVITDQGLYGALTLSVATAPFPGFLLSGQFQIELNTTLLGQTTSSGVSIPSQTFELHISGAGSSPDADLVIANVFDVSGYFNLTVSPAGFDLDAVGSIQFLGTELATGSVVASIYNDGKTELALYTELSLQSGGSLESAGVLDHGQPLPRGQHRLDGVRHWFDRVCGSRDDPGEHGGDRPQ